MKKYIFYTFFLFSLWSCDVNNNKINNTHQFDIERFDKLFHETTINNLSNLKNNYPFLFPEQYNSEVWINRLNDTIQKEIYNEINLVYSNLDDEKNDLIKFYNKNAIFLQ